ncbi:MAG: DUF3048 domain-containing protein [Clostridia bacterium]
MKNKFKNKFFSTVLVILIISCLLVSFSSCGQSGNPTPDPGNVDTASNETTSEIKRGNLNLLTGTYDLADSAVGKRPVSVMINNIKVALPQYGIGEADVIYEALAEGGITRLMAVFSDYTKMPKTGPVRSARDYYLDFAQPLDAMFVHWGTSNIAASEIKSRGVDNIDGMYWSSYYNTDKALAAQKGVEHSRFISGDGLVKIIDKKNERVDNKVKTAAFNFVLPEEEVIPSGQKCDYISAKFSSSYDATFEYNSENKIYMLSEFGKPHMDAGINKQLSFTNVIIIYAPVSLINDGSGKIDVDLKGGSGIYASKGGAENITWTKGDTSHDKQFIFKNTSGENLKFNTGKTYICVVPTTQQNSTVVRSNETSQVQ